MSILPVSGPPKAPKYDFLDWHSFGTRCDASALAFRCGTRRLECGLTRVESGDREFSTLWVFTGFLRECHDTRKASVGSTEIKGLALSHPVPIRYL
jgi:hypothetical protein